MVMMMREVPDYGGDINVIISSGIEGEELDYNFTLRTRRDVETLIEYIEDTIIPILPHE